MLGRTPARQEVVPERLAPCVRRLVRGHRSASRDAVSIRALSAVDATPRGQVTYGGRQTRRTWRHHVRRCRSRDPGRWRARDRACRWPAADPPGAPRPDRELRSRIGRDRHRGSGRCSRDRGELRPRRRRRRRTDRGHRPPGHPVARTMHETMPTFDVLPTGPGGPALRSHLPLVVTRGGTDSVLGVLALAHDAPIDPGDAARSPGGRGPRGGHHGARPPVDRRTGPRRRPSSRVPEPDMRHNLNVKTVVTRNPRRLTRLEAQSLTRRRLLDAAADEFCEQGFRMASLTDVADRAGYTIGAVYSNFSSKDGLFLAVMRDRLPRIEAMLAGALAADGQSASGPAASVDERITQRARPTGRRRGFRAFDLVAAPVGVSDPCRGRSEDVGRACRVRAPMPRDHRPSHRAIRG